MADLIEAGNVTGRKKNLNRGKHLATFCIGDQHLFETVSNDPQLLSGALLLRQRSLCHLPERPHDQRQHRHGDRHHRPDLLREHRAQAVLRHRRRRRLRLWRHALPGRPGHRGLCLHGQGGTISKIKSILTPGAAVSISRNLVDTVVTEYGVAELRGRTIRERADALIAIAHPDFRAQLRKEARDYGILVD